MTKEQAQRTSHFYLDLPFGEPAVTDFDATLGRALVRLGNRTACLPAHYSYRRHACNGDGDSLVVRSLAARYPSGRKVWDAAACFRKQDGNWLFEHAFDGSEVQSQSPAALAGFLKDFPAITRGVWGPLRTHFLADRLKPTSDGGPGNAAEVGNVLSRRALTTAKAGRAAIRGANVH
jgi:hypothetical protein